MRESSLSDRTPMPRVVPPSASSSASKMREGGLSLARRAIIMRILFHVITALVIVVITRTASNHIIEGDAEEFVLDPMALPDGRHYRLALGLLPPHDKHHTIDGIDQCPSI